MQSEKMPQMRADNGAGIKRSFFMPSGDGTGPVGMGMGTGLGRGWCRTGSMFGALGRVTFRGKKRCLLGLAVLVIAAAVRDLINPRGLLRQAAALLLSNRRQNGPQQNARDAAYTIVEEKISGQVKGGTAES
jgi:hypothetical protein